VVKPALDSDEIGLQPTKWQWWDGAYQLSWKLR